ncbi:MAG TPA: mechanosensitive ion channel family protein [Thermoanaerobaculaceae bacterium]|nr:mechanosensitive ion channel family protein [Thermoanaerobaculaceae bacterium]
MMAHAKHGQASTRRRHPLRAAALLVTAALAAAHGVEAAQQEIARREAINAGLGAPPPGAVRNSPAATWRSFLTLAEAGKFDQAANLLDLSATAPSQQSRVGAEGAEKLYRVLQLLKARSDAVTTEDEAGPTEAGKPTNVVVAQRFERSGITGEVILRHTVGLSPYELAWLFSRETVASIPFWYRVLVKGEAPRGAEPLDVGLGAIPSEVKRGTPREAVAGFLAACQEGRFDIASYYLDLGGIPPERQREEGAHLSRRLMLVLQRTGWVDLARLSNEPLGTPETGIPENQQLFAIVPVRQQPVELLLTHRADAELGHVWTVSQETVAEIDRMYAAHGYGWLGDHAPLALFAVSVADLQLAQWLGILAGLLASWLVSRYLARWIVRLLVRLARRTMARWDDAVGWALNGPATVLLSALVLLIAARWLGLVPLGWTIVRYIAKLLALLGVGWFLVRLVDAGAEHVRETARAGSQAGLGFLPVATRVAKSVVVLLIGFAILDLIGINMIAGLGALGLTAAAIAFAAQKSLENLFGTASIASDRPFEVGDFVAIGEDKGTVEDIGLRSTRLRTLARTLVTIPNGLIAAGRVENYSARDSIMYNPVLGLRYDTTRGQLTSVIEGINQLLRTHPKVVPETHRVRFAAFGESSLRVEIWCWIATRDYVEYTAIVEDLNFAIAEIVERTGTSFAFPTRTIRIAQIGHPGADGLHGVGERVPDGSPSGPRGDPGRREPDAR